MGAIGRGIIGVSSISLNIGIETFPVVIPANAGIQRFADLYNGWVPAFAGTTAERIALADDGMSASVMFVTHAMRVSP